MKRLEPSAPSVILPIRFTVGMVRALDARAAAEGRTRSEVVRDAVVAALRRKPRGKVKGGSDAT